MNRWRTLVVSVLVALGIGACDTGGSPGPGDTERAPYLLQARLSKALPPEDQFGLYPGLTITSERVVVIAGAVPAVFPGPLLPNLLGRTITESGYERIVAEAAAAGLLGDDPALDAPAPGRAIAEIDLWVDGAMRTLRGDPNAVMQCIRAPCNPAPGTPEAFGAFWNGINDLATVMPEELGAEEAYTPAAFAVLVGVRPIDDAGLEPQVLEWPLDTPLGKVGRPIGDEPFPRCAIVRGEDAALLAPLLATANQLTQWTDETDGEPVVIRVSPIPGGGDPCVDLFGLRPEPS